MNKFELNQAGPHNFLLQFKLGHYINTYIRTFYKFIIFSTNMSYTKSAIFIHELCNFCHIYVYILLSTPLDNKKKKREYMYLHIIGRL